MNFFAALLKWRKPNVGEIWGAENGNPFQSVTVKVLAIKNGWVQYQMGYWTTEGRGFHCAPDSLDLRTFLYCYSPIDGA